jgi:hypothetical protein
MRKARNKLQDSTVRSRGHTPTIRDVPNRRRSARGPAALKA